MLTLVFVTVVGTCQAFAGNSLLFEKRLVASNRSVIYQQCQSLLDEDTRLNRVPTGVNPPERSIRVVF